MELSGSPGFDNLNAIMVKKIPFNASRHISNLNNVMIFEEKLSDTLKVTRVLTILKAGKNNMLMP